MVMNIAPAVCLVTHTQLDISFFSCSDSALLYTQFTTHTGVTLGARGSAVG
jgi:hypothetical protein